MPACRWSARPVRPGRASRRLPTRPSASCRSDPGPKLSETTPESHPAMISGSNSDAERLIQIDQDVIDVLDAHAQANTAGTDPGGQLFLRRHLAVRRRCGMARQGFGVAQIDQALEQLQRIVETHAGRQSTAYLECHEGAGSAAEIFLHQGVVGAVGKYIGGRACSLMTF